jgi:hypothetical protein
VVEKHVDRPELHCRTSVAHEMSAPMAMAWPPASSLIRSVRSSAVGRPMSMMTMLVPLVAKSYNSAPPIPVTPPKIRVILPWLLHSLALLPHAEIICLFFCSSKFLFCFLPKQLSLRQKLVHMPLSWIQHK